MWFALIEYNRLGYVPGLDLFLNVVCLENNKWVKSKAVAERFGFINHPYTIYPLWTSHHMFVPNAQEPLEEGGMHKGIMTQSIMVCPTLTSNTNQEIM